MERKKITANQDRYLRKLYFSPGKSGSFSGITQFYDAVKRDGKYNLSKHMVEKWLRGNDVYTTTRKTTPKFLRPSVIVISVDETWEIDLADLSQFAKENDGYKYILMCIDVFSRYLWARPLRSKYAEEVVKQLRSIINEGRKPRSVRSDSGHDVYNNEITRDIMIPFHIKQYVTHNELQANYVERVIKSIKSRLWRYFRHSLKPRWVDILQDIVKSYNNTVHSSLGVTPASVNKENERWIRLDQAIIKKKKYPKYYAKIEPRMIEPKAYKFKLGIHVRMPMTRNKSKREYQEKWTGEIFKIVSRFRKQGLNFYKLADLHDKDVEGSFAEAELQRVNYNPAGVFLINEVGEQKKINGVPHSEVQWYGWPSSFNSYIPTKDLGKYKVKT